MNCEVELEELSKDFIKELGNIGTGNAVNALSQLLNCPLEIDTPNLRVLPFQRITEIIAEAETPLTGIMVEVFGRDQQEPVCGLSAAKDFIFGQNGSGRRGPDPIPVQRWLPGSSGQFSPSFGGIPDSQPN